MESSNPVVRNVDLSYRLPEGYVGFVYVYDLTPSGVVIKDPLVLLPGESIQDLVVETLGYGPETIAEVSYIRGDPKVVDILSVLDKHTEAAVRQLLAAVHAVGVKTGEFSGTDSESGMPTFRNFVPEQHEGICSWPRP